MVVHAWYVCLCGTLRACAVDLRTAILCGLLLGGLSRLIPLSPFLSPTNNQYPWTKTLFTDWEGSVLISLFLVTSSHTPIHLENKEIPTTLKLFLSSTPLFSRRNFLDTFIERLHVKGWIPSSTPLCPTDLCKVRQYYQYTFNVTIHEAFAR